MATKHRVYIADYLAVPGACPCCGYAYLTVPAEDDGYYDTYAEPVVTEEDQPVDTFKCPGCGRHATLSAARKRPRR